MSMASFTTHDIVYPESDGKPMSENMKQGRMIRMLISGFDRLFADDPMVLVGGDCFWYPLAGEPTVNVSPDVIVVFDTPKVDRPSVRTFEHGGVVRFVAEVVSPSNTYGEMRRKREFYEAHGVEEYWVYDPDSATLEVWHRVGDRLDQVIRPDNGWQSPLFGVTLRVEDGELYVRDPDGEIWLDSQEEGRLARERQRVVAAAEARAEAAEARAEAAEARAEAAEARAEAAEARITTLESDLAAIRTALAKLREDRD